MFSSFEEGDLDLRGMKEVLNGFCILSKRPILCAKYHSISMILKVHIKITIWKSVTINQIFVLIIRLKPVDHYITFDHRILVMFQFSRYFEWKFQQDWWHFFEFQYNHVFSKKVSTRLETLQSKLLYKTTNFVKLALKTQRKFKA